MHRQRTLLTLLAVLVLTTGISFLANCVKKGPSITDLPPKLEGISTSVPIETLTWLEDQAKRDRGHVVGINRYDDAGVGLVRYDFDEDGRFELTLVNTDAKLDSEVIFFNLDEDDQDDYARIARWWYKNEPEGWTPLAVDAPPFPDDVTRAVEVALAPWTTPTPIPPTVTPSRVPTDIPIPPTLTPPPVPTSTPATLDPDIVQMLHIIDLAMVSVVSPMPGTWNVQGTLLDVLGYDLDGDKDFEAIAVDLDRDSRFEIRLYDVDGDQYTDYAKEDVNRDGQFEELMIYQHESEQWVPLYSDALPLPLPFPYLYFP